MMYYCYILYSKTADQFYIGHTNNPEERLKKHNTNHKGYTGKYSDWKIVHIEQFCTKEAAYAREIREKQNRKTKNNEILQSNSQSFNIKPKGLFFAISISSLISCFNFSGFSGKGTESMAILPFVTFLGFSGVGQVPIATISLNKSCMGE